MLANIEDSLGHQSVSGAVLAGVCREYTTDRSAVLFSSRSMGRTSLGVSCARSAQLGLQNRGQQTSSDRRDSNTQQSTCGTSRGTTAAQFCAAKKKIVIFGVKLTCTVEESVRRIGRAHKDKSVKA
jgi:hypothetical protein